MNSALETPDFPAQTRLSAQETRLSMSRVILGWSFGAIFVQLATGAVYAAFARQLGASEATFGFLSGLNPLMSWLQIPAARLIEGKIGARNMMIRAGLASRALWVVAALLPVIHAIFPALVPRAALLPAFIACVLLSSLGQACIGPAFFAWMTALIPDRVGPSFWAKRSQIGTVVAIFAVVLGGFVADHAGDIKAWSGGHIPPLLTYSALLTLAAICGVIDIAAFLGVKEPPSVGNQSGNAAPFLASIKEPLREPEVRNYLFFITTAMMGFATTGPLLWLFCLEYLDFDKTQTGLLLTICPLLGMAVSAKGWGGMIRAHGTRPVLRFCSMGLILVPLCWLFALPENKIGLALMLFASGLLVSAYEIANLNFLTRACPHLPRPTLAALFSICAGTTFALTAWGAGWLAGALKAFHFEAFGLTFVNYHLILAFSLLPRVLNAFVCAPRLENYGTSGTRDMMSEVGENLAAAIGPKWSRLFASRGE